MKSVINIPILPPPAPNPLCLRGETSNWISSLLLNLHWNSFIFIQYSSVRRRCDALDIRQLRRPDSWFKLFDMLCFPRLVRLHKGLPFDAYSLYHNPLVGYMLLSITWWTPQSALINLFISAHCGNNYSWKLCFNLRPANARPNLRYAIYFNLLTLFIAPTSLLSKRFAYYTHDIKA